MSAARAQLIKNAVASFRQAEAIVVTCGAGMGVDSGLPDFRGDKGFWKEYPPIAERGLSFIECADPEHFNKDPDFAWGFYGHRLHLYQACTPGEHFHILKRLMGATPHGGFVFTSNVDGQFQKAGYDDHRIVECHGSIHHLQAVDGSGGIDAVPESLRINVDKKTFLAQKPLPTMANGKLARPNILMFGDYYWIADRTEKQYSLFSAWLNALKKQSVQNVVVVDIGSGTAVPTARNTAATVANKFEKGILIRINPREPQTYPAKRAIAFDEGALSILRDIECSMLSP